MNEIVKTDSTQVDNLLSKLSDDDFKRDILIDGLKAGAKVLQENAQSNFRARVSGATHHSPYIKKPFFRGVKMKVDKDYTEVIVSIMSDFRMKFFEKGTKERQTKGRKIVGKESFHRLKREGKGHKTGHITATNFFRDARSQEGDINNAIEQSITRALNNL